MSIQVSTSTKSTFTQLVADGGLSDKAIATLAPAAATEGSHATGASERYQQVSTMELIRAARSEGFVVTRASQPSGSMGDPFAKHRIDMILAGAAHGSEGFPTVTILNSHDRTKALTAIMGYFRLICENGLIISDGPTRKVRSLHLGDALKDLPKYIGDVTMMLSKTHELVEPMMARKTSAPERSVLASLVMEIRWKGYPKTPVTPAMLLQAHRPEDEANDLWSVLNRVQENTVRGGIKGVTGRTTNGVKSFYGDMSVNRACWAGAEAILAGSVSRVNKLRKELAILN